MEIHRMRPSIVVAALVLACVLGAVPRTANALSEKEEIELGQKIDAEIMKKNQLDPDEQAQKEIDEYGRNLVKFVKRTQIPYHFKILKDDEFNAFCIPGGYVYFTSRLWNVMRKDERIGVLAHEITHTDERHAIDAISKQQRRRTIISIILLATKASDVWGDIASLAEQMYTLKYSRGDEQRADTGAVTLCQKAGYNPAGILLAMYKIKRFEDEAGGAPPKIFSDHPPTAERLQYLKQLLTSRGIPVPPENIQTVNMPDRIGEVTSVSGNTIAFTSSKPLSPGDSVWVMREGWDFYYEKRTAVPAARAVVVTPGTTVSANIYMIPSTKKVQIANRMGVYAPPAPKVENSVGSLAGRLLLSNPPAMFERLMAVQTVWNDDNTRLINDNVGYLVIVDPGSDRGYIGVQRSKYSYTPMETGSALVKFNDPDQNYWIGPIVSIGRRGSTIEVKPVRALDKDKTYEILYPAWRSDVPYDKRIVGTARLESTSPKVVLKMTGYSAGWSIVDIQNGFDVYEQKPKLK